MMDTSGLPHAKPRPAKLERHARKVIRESLDKAENQKVKARSGGRCEVQERCSVVGLVLHVASQARCPRRAIHIHHKLGGHGVRGRGASALAENKLHACAQCHSDIHSHVLVPDDDYFRRVK